MKLYICKNYDEVSATAAEIVEDIIKSKPSCVLGLATGSTPLGMYTKLTQLNREGILDFSKVKTFNLDEYYPISPTDNQSYRYFMNKNLFDNINIDMDNTHVLNGEASDTHAECAAYDKAIEAAGGIDLQVLGIGNNGHIGFNEPDDSLIATTHLTELTKSTVQANSRFFASESDVPKYALTMGIRSILNAKKIVILINGKAKHKVLREMLDGKITTQNPATLLNLHRDVTVICDEDAYIG